MNIRQIKSLALLNLKGNWGNFIAIYLSLSALTVFLVLDHMLTYQILKLSGITDFYSINFFNYPTLASIMIIKTMAMLCILVMIRFMVKRQFADIKHGKGITNSRNAMYKDLFAFFKISFVPYLIKYLIVLALIIPSILGAFLIRKQIIYSKTNEITLPFLFIFMTV
ncbi:MAG: hypothetical protein GX896_04465, partial [Clostridiales bacterium]|nr:hypothetical protein [Clostridiales bacterium]